MAIPVSLNRDEFEPIKPKERDRRVCACGHLMKSHEEQFGSCDLRTRGGGPRCLCANPRSVGTTNTPVRWTASSPAVSGQRTNASRGVIHPFELALRRGADFTWDEGQPTCDECGKPAGSTVEFRTWSDGQTRISCGCP